MNICLDYQPAVAQRAGIGRYTRALAEHLAAQRAPADRLRLFYFDFRRAAEPPALPGLEACPWRRLPGAWVQQAWKRLGRPAFDRLAGPADVFHFTNFVVPPLRRGRVVATVHDMSFERFPQFAERRNLRYLRAGLDRSVARADVVMTISRFSADEIETFLPSARGKLRVVYPGIDGARFRPPSAEAVSAVRGRLGLDRPYLLSVGTLEPRKNYPLLFEAFDALDEFDGDLVLAGMPGWSCEPIQAALRRAKRHERIRWLRHVSDADLPGLYAGAELFVMPSVYEGFGFPPLESMACGTPVIASAGGSLPEVLGEAAWIVRSFERDAWVAALAALLSDAARRDRLRAAGFAQARRYHWADAARAVWTLYREVCP